MRKPVEQKSGIRYSEAYKMEVVRELEMEGEPFDRVRRKYGIGNGTVQQWVRKYGNGSRGKVIKVHKPQEIDEMKRLKDRVRRLESALADANLELALERAYTKMACGRAGIQDIQEFKKKAGGSPHTAS